MSYQGKILRFVDARDRTHLIFNHYNPNLSQAQVHAEIKSSFGLDYKFGSENEMATVFNSGGVLTEISAQYSPQQLLTTFGEVEHPDLPQRNAADPLTAEDVRIVLYTNLEPPYSNTVVATQDPNGPPRGGRYFKTNFSRIDDANIAENRAHRNKWDGYGESTGSEVRYVVSNTSPQQISVNNNNNVNDSNIAFTNGTEIADTGVTGSALDNTPKAYFYVYSRIGSEFLDSNFTQDENRVYQLVKPHLIGGPVVATTTQELEQQVVDRFQVYDASFVEINRLITSLTNAIGSNTTNGSALQRIQSLETLTAAGGVIMTDIGTRATSAELNAATDTLNNSITTVNSNIGKVSGVIHEMNESLHNYYNYEWTKWSPPPVVDKKLTASGSISMIELASIQTRKNRKRQVQDDTQKMMKDVKADIVKLAKINNTVLELLNDNL